MSAVSAMAAMRTMASVHKDVHQWTGEKEQPRQNSQDVSPVLGNEQRSSHSQESDENETAPRGPEVTARGNLVMRMLVVCHVALLIQR
jgi:hypothetical protein